ncbi:hypothetical protein IT415_02345 [bacterium]|nr:hypothetical protein [bacterium]
MKRKSKLGFHIPGKADRVLPVPEGVKAWQAGLLVMLGLVFCGFIIWRSFAAGW